MTSDDILTHAPRIGFDVDSDAAEARGGTDRILQMIDTICPNPDFREPDEPAPSAEAQQGAKQLIEEASELLAGAIPYGDAATYWGELSVTWRNGARLLRLAYFSDGRHPRLDWGISPFGAIGEYSTSRVFDSPDLADAIRWLRYAVS